MIKNNRSKQLTYRKLVYSYFLIICIEIISRYFFTATPLSLFLPAILLLMSESLKNKRINILKYRYLFLPFIGFTLLFSYVFIKYPFNYALHIWSPVFNIGYSVISLLYIAPLLLQLIGNYLTFRINWQSTTLFILFIVHLVYALETLIIMHLSFSTAKTNNQFSTLEVNGYWVNWFLLIISLLVTLCYLLGAKKESQLKTYPTLKELEEYKQKILESFNLKKNFLEPTFSINTLSIETGISKNDLHYFFDFYLQKSFLDITAEYRINHAIELMHGEGKFYTIEAIAQESGYKSRASFNKYFKQITGTLPSQYFSSLKK